MMMRRHKSTTMKTTTSTHTPFLLSDIGEGIAEVELLQWFVRSGDEIAQFDRLCEVQSDKATVEITSRFDGKIVNLCGDVGDMIKVGSPLMHIHVDGDGANSVISHEEDDDVHAHAHAASLHNINDEEDMLQIPSKASSSYQNYVNVNGLANGAASNMSAVNPISTEKVQTTPAVRKIAKENNIDLYTIAGTGINGRILKSDLLDHLNGGQQFKSFDQITTNTANIQPEKIENKALLGSHHDHDQIEPIRGVARLMAKSMTLSLQVPHFSYADEVTMDNLKDVRENLKPIAEAEGLRLTYMPFAIKAASIALNQYPKVNCSFDDSSMTLRYHQDHNIGVAMDTSRGLVVPVIRACQNLSIFEITRELNRLQSAAAEGKLTESDFADCTFSLSNIGVIGGTYMKPVIVPPQVAIGAIGKIQRLPRFVGETDEVIAAHIMQVSWSGDHRVLEGSVMANFSNSWKLLMENPSRMILKLK
eukprot:CAMPEP_0116038672 /NCGR_PEP_ID=MMETSP0321-20121206/22985_1 /TAXON_ID=163516 /ORGANISM="Leptocylindrus danicus var. danicus, Strain B650" /LENGTH=475 /DNA_ID=CAMNT_0003517505 /DNA_START=226 /DNA_END=1653 /DNA_ORIENTATION=-